MVYQTESYDYWRTHLHREDLTPGSFGENFTVNDLPDETVCIGDRYRIGDAEFEVTQPRVTCVRVGMRLGCSRQRCPSGKDAHLVRQGCEGCKRVVAVAGQAGPVVGDEELGHVGARHK